MRVTFMGTAILGLFVGVSSAWAQTTTEPQIWQGDAFITGFPSAAAKTACEGYAAIGDFYRVVYRPIILASSANGANQDEGLSFFGSRNALHYHTDIGVSFATPGQAYVYYFGTHGQSSGQNNPPATVPFSLHITPENLVLDTKIVTILGTLDEWENHPGCSVDIRAALTLRVD